MPSTLSTVWWKDDRCCTTDLICIPAPGSPGWQCPLLNHTPCHRAWSIKQPHLPYPLRDLGSCSSMALLPATTYHYQSFCPPPTASSKIFRPSSRLRLNERRVTYWRLFRPYAIVIEKDILCVCASYLKAKLPSTSVLTPRTILYHRRCETLNRMIFLSVIFLLSPRVQFVPWFLYKQQHTEKTGSQPVEKILKFLTCLVFILQTVEQVYHRPIRQVVLCYYYIGNSSVIVFYGKSTGCSSNRESWSTNASFRNGS